MHVVVVLCNKQLVAPLVVLDGDDALTPTYELLALTFDHLRFATSLVSVICRFLVVGRLILKGVILTLLGWHGT